MKKIYLSGDHAGFKIKENLKQWFEKKGFEVNDLGPHFKKDGDDYPDYVIPMAKAMLKDRSREVKGIIIAGSGMGEAIAINKLKGIRAAVYHGKNLKIVKTTREHNDSNVLCMGARFVKEAEMKKAIKAFLETPFGKGRHKRRLSKFEKLGS